MVVDLRTLDIHNKKIKMVINGKPKYINNLLMIDIFSWKIKNGIYDYYLNYDHKNNVKSPKTCLIKITKDIDYEKWHKVLKEPEFNSFKYSATTKKCVKTKDK